MSGAKLPLERHPAAPSNEESGRLFHDFDTLRLAASRAQNAAVRFREHTMDLYTRSVNSVPALPVPQLSQGTPASMSSGPLFQHQAAGSDAPPKSCTVAHDVEISTSASVVGPSAKLHSGSSKYRGSTSATSVTRPMSGSKTVIDLTSPEPGFYTPNLRDENLLTTIPTSGPSGLEAWSYTHVSNVGPSRKTNVGSGTQNINEDKAVVDKGEQGTRTAAGAKKRGRPLGSKNKNRLQPQKDPFCDMIFSSPSRKGERTRRSKLGAADNPGDHDAPRKSKVQSVALSSKEALLVGSLHAQKIDPLQPNSNGRGSHSIPQKTRDRVPGESLHESPNEGKVAPTPDPCESLSPHTPGSLGKTSGHQGVSSSQDSAAITLAFQNEIYPIIRKACLRFQHTSSASAMTAIETECAEKVINPKLFKYLRNNKYHLSSVHEREIKAIVDAVLERRTNRAISKGMFRGEKSNNVAPAADSGKDAGTHLRADLTVKSPRFRKLHNSTREVYSDNHSEAVEKQNQTVSFDPPLPLVALPDAAPSRRGRFFAGLTRVPTKRAAVQDRRTLPVHQNLVHYVPKISTMAMGKLLRDRELGSKSQKSSAPAMRHHISERLTHRWTWTGVSKDVLVAAWAPNGSTYAVGGSTDLDNLNLQYNRRNNLLLGKLDENILYELPDHYRSETMQRPDITAQATYNSEDQEIYTTVTSVCFSTRGNFMFTASYDKTVKIWDVTTEEQRPRCLHTLEHDAEVEHLAVSRKHPSLLATGQKCIDKSIRVYDTAKKDFDMEKAPLCLKAFSSSNASWRECYVVGLQWGTAPSTSNLLLAGFSENKADLSSADREGDLCLWDVETGTAFKLHTAAQSVFDVCWHHRLPLFAAATTPGTRSNLTDRFNTRSVIRTYRPVETPGRIMEYECPASDINDVRFHPFDDHYISAGCTNGNTYVWDFRMPDRILHKLCHGPVIDELNELFNRDEQDTGVRLSLWDQDGQLFYTGSSDGTIKTWNIYRSTEDVFVRDIAQFDSGVMCGTFSNDYTNLLVGSAKGAVHILSTSPMTDSDDDDEPYIKGKGSCRTIRYIPFDKPTAIDEDPSGISQSRALVASKKLTMHPIYGAGQGPSYDGPYAAYAHPRGRNPATTDLLPDIRATQLDVNERRRGRKAGGRVDNKEKQRYRDYEKLAYARFLEQKAKKQEGKRKKRGRESEAEGRGGGMGTGKRSKGKVGVAGILQEHAFINDGDEEDTEDKDAVADEEIDDPYEEDYYF